MVRGASTGDYLLLSVSTSYLLQSHQRSESSRHSSSQANHLQSHTPQQKRLPRPPRMMAVRTLLQQNLRRERGYLMTVMKSCYNAFTHTDHMPVGFKRTPTK